jgi:hypothetical protein
MTFLDTARTRQYVARGFIGRLHVVPGLLETGDPDMDLVARMAVP